MYIYRLWTSMNDSNMSEQNNEAQRAQEQYEIEKEMANDQPVSTSMNTEHTPTKVREGWRTTDGKFYRFENYDNLPAEYKTFLPRKSTKGKLAPDGIEPIVHVDPVDGKTYRYWITFFPNGGSSVSSMEWNASSGGTGGSYQRKTFYMDIGVGEHTLSEANALLSANENDRVFRYKKDGNIQISTTTKAPDGTVTVSSRIVYVLLKQKKIEYG
jgi:hypothetical protein